MLCLSPIRLTRWFALKTDYSAGPELSQCFCVVVDAVDEMIKGAGWDGF